MGRLPCEAYVTQRSPIRLAFRCPVPDAEGLRDRDGRRWCDRCDRAVHDLTDATEVEALARLAEDGGHTCGTVRVASDGRVLLRAATVALLAACAPASEPPVATTAEPVLRDVPPLPLPAPILPHGLLPDPPTKPPPETASYTPGPTIHVIGAVVARRPDDEEP